MRSEILLISFFVLYLANGVTAVSGQPTNDQLDMLLANCQDINDLSGFEKTSYCVAIVNTIDELCHYTFYPACMDSKYWIVDVDDLV